MIASITFRSKSATLKYEALCNGVGLCARARPSFNPLWPSRALPKAVDRWLATQGRERVSYILHAEGGRRGNNEVVEEANAKKNIIAIQPLSGQSE